MHMWHCQIEGDEVVTLRAETAVQAAREYVRGGDWSPEEDGWNGTGVLSVRVIRCAEDGSADPANADYVSVEMRDGQVVR